MSSDGFYSHALVTTIDVLPENIHFLLKKMLCGRLYWWWNSTGSVLEKYFFLLISLQTGDLQIAVNIEGRVRNYSLEDLTGAPWYRLPLILQSEIWEPLLLLLIVTLVLYILDLPKSDSSKFVVIKGKVGIS